MKFLFDLGGVFFDWDPHYFFKDIFSDSADLEYFLSSVCNDEWNIKQDAGRIIKTAEEELIPKFPQYEEQIKLYYPNHRKMIKKVFAESIDVLHELKEKNYSSYVLSNWSAETFVGMTDDYPFLKLFDGLLISGEVKLVKPSQRIYELALQRFNLELKETVFIDDKLENVKVAKKLGFNIIHLSDPKDIKKKIKEFLV